MLFWISIAILVVGIILWIIEDNTKHDVYDAATWFTVIGAVLVIICMLCMLTYVNRDGYVDKMQTRYEMLTYQYENNIYDNDNDLGKRELMLDIQNWNEDLSWNKAMQDNFWIGIFIPNIYDQFELIELK